MTVWLCLLIIYNKVQRPISLFWHCYRIGKKTLNKKRIVHKFSNLILRLFKTYVRTLLHSFLIRSKKIEKERKKKREITKMQIPCKRYIFFPFSGYRKVGGTVHSFFFSKKRFCFKEFLRVPYREGVRIFLG